jgi:hypothetical protein
MFMSSHVLVLIWALLSVPTELGIMGGSKGSSGPNTRMKIPLFVLNACEANLSYYTRHL